MMMNRFASYFAAPLLLLATTCVAAQATPAATHQLKAIPKKTAVAPAAPTDAGDRAFQAHCSRCHDAPQSISPSITGTVIRHMRVRANLSVEEERLILHYMNP